MAPPSRWLITQPSMLNAYEFCSLDSWYRQHETMDRLNIQAHKNAINSSDEYVMESFVTFEKVSHRSVD